MSNAFRPLIARTPLLAWGLALVLATTTASSVLSGRVAPGAVGISVFGTPVTESFDSLVTSGTATWINDSTIPGWYARSGTGMTIVANNGGSNAGNLYSYGTGTGTERALGRWARATRPRDASIGAPESQTTPARPSRR